MNDNHVGFLVTCREINKDFCPIGDEKGVAIFKNLSDASEWADMKNSCSESQEYTVFGIRDFHMERWVN